MASLFPGFNEKIVAPGWFLNLATAHHKSKQIKEDMRKLIPMKTTSEKRSGQIDDSLLISWLNNQNLFINIKNKINFKLQLKSIAPPGMSRPDLGMGMEAKKGTLESRILKTAGKKEELYSSILPTSSIMKRLVPSLTCRCIICHSI